MLGLEYEYIQHLEETHHVGYAKQLFHDNEYEYYKGMYMFLKGGQ